MSSKKKKGSTKLVVSKKKSTKDVFIVSKSPTRKSSNYKKDKNLLASTYDIWVNGTKLGINKKQCIQSIDIKDTVDGSDVATIDIVDPEFLFIEDNIFLEESKVTIKLGWVGYTYRVKFTGYISAIDIDFDSTGIPKMTLTCMDNTHRMNRQKKNKTFKKCTNADVVKSIVKSYGYSCVVEKGYKFKKHDSITQSNQTDIEFITKLASDEVHPFTARLIGNTFYYVKMGKLGTPKQTLHYKDYPHEIISFSPKINTETKQKSISSSSVSTKDKSVSKSTGTVGNSSSNSRGSASKNGSASSKSASGGYTYNPSNKSWSKGNKKK